MSTNKKKPGGKGAEETTIKQPWTFDPTVMVCIESGVDGTRIFADRNCVATCRRLADLIPPLIPPPPPPLDPKEAKKLAAASQKAGSSQVKGGNNNSGILSSLTGEQEVNRGPSSVSPLFDEDVNAQQPKTSGKLVLENVDEDVIKKGGLDDQQPAATEINNDEDGDQNNTSSTTPIVPVIRIECLNGRQIEAAIRISYFKYMGDYTSEVEKRKAIAFESLGVSAEELLAIGTILGC